MITASVRDLLTRGWGLPHGGEGHCVYVVREGETVFYVGRSYDPVNRLHEHLDGGLRPKLSALGALILDNRPGSLAWQIDYLTLDDCEPYVTEYLPHCVEYYARRELDADKIAEGAVIARYRPCLNVIGNPNPHPLPECYERPLFKNNIAAMVGL